MKRCLACKLLFSNKDAFCSRCGGSLTDVSFWERHRSAFIPVIAVGLLIGAVYLADVPERKRRAESAAGSSEQKASSPQSPINGAEIVKRVRWGYSEYSDDMGRGRVYHTSTVSTNTISLDAPYQGAQHATLSIREHPQHGRDVYISIERGQLLDSDYHGKVVARFDRDKPMSFSSVRPADLSSETLFLRGNAFSVFINRLKTAKTLRIEVPVYEAGGQVFDFDVEGFTWKETKTGRPKKGPK